MDASRFDAWTRTLAAGTSRRRVLAGLFGLAMGGLVQRAGGVRAAACERDADCGPGQTCFNAGCRPHCTTTGPCQSDDECCGPGQTCVNGTCHNPGEGSAGGCASDADCAPGQTCFNAACQHQCTTTGPCQTDDDCCGPGQTCVNGSCHNPGDPLPEPATAPSAPSASGAAGVSGTGYESPSYGYRLTWDGTWSVTRSTSAGGRDELVLSNGTAGVGFFGYAGSDDPSQCLQRAKSSLFDPTKTRQVAIGTDTSNRPMQAATAERAYAVYTYQDTSEGTPQDRAAILDCRALVPGHAALLIVADVARDAYNAQYPAVQALLARLVLPLAGIQTYSNLSHQHTTDRVAYPQIPPVGGAHNPVWQNCGFYATVVASEHAVHSLEHGAIWITYQPGLPADQLAVLKRLAQTNDYVLVSAFPGLPAPVVATAWGVQLRLNGADPAILQDFITAYRHGPDTEQGGACSGGTSSPGF